MAKNAKQGGNSRKKGRMKHWCLLYKNRQQRERNKARTLTNHLRRFPADAVALDALAVLPKQFVPDLHAAYIREIQSEINARRTLKKMVPSHA